MNVDPKAKEGWERVRNDCDEEHWMIVRVADNGKSLDHIETSTAGLAELRAKLADMHGIMYCGLRVNAVDQRGSVTSVRFRFVLISLITQDVPVIKRAKAGMAKGLADTLFHGTSVYLNLDHADEVTEEAIRAKLEANCGAHRPSGYEFDGIASPSYSPRSPTSPKPASPKPEPKKEAVKKEEPKEEAPKAEKKEEPKKEEPKKEEPKEEKKEEAKTAPTSASAPSSDGELRAEEKMAEPNKPQEEQQEEPKKEDPKKDEEPKKEEAKMEEPKEEEPKKEEPKKEAPKEEKKEEPKKEDPKKEEVKKEEVKTAPATKQEPAPTKAPAAPADIGTDAAAAWRKVKDDNESLNWLMLSFDKQPRNAIIFAAGEGGLDEFKAHLSPDRVIFGGLRCKAVDDRGSVKSVRTKLIFVQQNGENVKAMTRAAAGPAKGHYESILAGTHISMNISGPEDLEEQDLVKKLQNSCGAHAPTGYEFN